MPFSIMASLHRIMNIKRFTSKQNITMEYQRHCAEAISLYPLYQGNLNKLYKCNDLCYSGKDFIKSKPFSKKHITALKARKSPKRRIDGNECSISLANVHVIAITNRSRESMNSELKRSNDLMSSNYDVEMQVGAYVSTHKCKSIKLRIRLPPIFVNVNKRNAKKE